MSIKTIPVNYPNIPVLSRPGEDIVLGQFIPSPFDPQNDFKDHEAQVVSKDMYLPNFSLRSIEGTFSRTASLYNENGDGLELPGSCLFLRGNVYSHLPHRVQPLESFHRTQNFKYDPDNDFTHFLPGNESFHLVHVSYTSEYLSEFLPEGELWAEQLKMRIRNRERIHGERSVLINEAQDRALDTIFNNPLTGKLGVLMLETAVVQIILLQLNGLFQDCPLARRQGLSRRDIETVYALKEHLSSKFLEDHSLQSLSMHFGVNTNKLMASFKKLFGKSIFEFIQEQRMTYAQRLLREQDMQITEVARTVGYKNPNHFSAAFKRQFGVNPSQVRA